MIKRGWPLLLAFLLGLLPGLWLGKYWAAFEDLRSTGEWNERRDQFQVRTEGYEPSCAELRNKGAPGIVTRGSDHFIVIVRDHDFIVFGLNAEPGKAPITAWWSAGLAAALRQACGE